MFMLYIHGHPGELFVVDDAAPEGAFASPGYVIQAAADNYRLPSCWGQETITPRQPDPNP